MLILTALAAPIAAQQTGPPASVTCQVAGYDVILVNVGTEPLVKGSEIAWVVRFARMESTHQLTEMLEPGRMVFLTGALGSSYLNTNTPCEIVPSSAQ